MFFTIKIYLHLNCVLILNWIVWNRTIFIKMDLALNNLQRLICHKTQTTNQPTKEYMIPYNNKLFVLRIGLFWFICLMGYLMPKPSAVKRDWKIHIFPLGISPKVNVKVWLEYEHSDFDFSVQHISHTTTAWSYNCFLKMGWTDKKIEWTKRKQIIKIEI